jgi:NAD+ diphosphatase
MTGSNGNPAADPPANPVPFAFVEGALDRADALRDDPAALAALWPRARVVLLDDDGRALADAAQGLFAPVGDAIGGGPGTAIFLGLRDGVGWFAQRAATIAPDVVEPATQRVDLRSAAAAWTAFEATVFAQARALLHWHARHRHCGACAGELDFVRAGWLGRCRQCGSEHYPRTDQAIIVAVTDGARLLLGRQSTWPARRWSVLAGFVEPGESLEQTVAREVLEETGVRVRSCQYLASQPWPFPGALMLGFLAQADADTPVAGDELEDARWFDAASVRAGLARDWNAVPDAGSDDADGIVLSSPISIARWLAERWLATQPG